jgi:hypothetical protein
MLGTILLYLIYVYMAVLFLKQSSFVQSIGINYKIIIGLFLLKIIGGLFYYYIMKVRFYGGDSHAYYMEAYNHIKNLNTNWKWELNYFIYGWSPIRLNEHYYSVKNSVAWSDLGSQLNYRIMYISTLLSFGHETVNIIFYNLLFFMGQLAMYKAFINIAPSKKAVLLFIVFAIPSVWFWCSGIHKDGFMLSLMGMLLLNMYRWCQHAKPKYFLYMFLALAGFFCIRYYIGLLIIPIWVTFLIANQLKTVSPAKIYSASFVAFVLLFFNVHHLVSALQPANMVVIKQKQFLNLKGNSLITMDTLKPTLSSFIIAAPKAFTRVLTRPYVTDAKDTMYLITSLETLLLLFLIVLLLFARKQPTNNGAILYFCIITCVITFLIIGYIVPFSGAFIRYRAAYYPLIIGALYCTSNLPFLQKIEEKSQNWVL